jgi:predicted glutamine amidotransferase
MIIISSNCSWVTWVIRKNFDIPFAESSSDTTLDPSTYTVIASEPLSNDTKEWKEVPKNHYIHVDAHQKVHLKSFSNKQEKS